jgi:DNA-binding response OmpR family regulator
VIEENKTLYQDQEIELSKNEAKILHILLEKKDTIVSREEMMNYLWKTDFYVDENTLSVNVNRLRKKLESIGCTNYIETKKGLGYKI